MTQLCEAGFKIEPNEPCAKCGATEDEWCFVQEAIEKVERERPARLATTPED